jgi:hypothetical protein
MVLLLPEKQMAICSFYLANCRVILVDMNALGKRNTLLPLAFFGLEGIELQVDRHHYIKEQR